MNHRIASFTRAQEVRQVGRAGDGNGVGAVIEPFAPILPRAAVAPRIAPTMSADICVRYLTLRGSCSCGGAA